MSVNIKIKNLEIPIKVFISWMYERNFQNQKEININKEDFEHFTHLKLHKLLYFLEGCFLAKYKNSLFGDNFEAWKYGPVIPSLYQWLKHELYTDSNAIVSYKAFPKCKNLSKYLSKDQIQFLEKCFDYWNAFSGLELTHSSHLGGPWPKTPLNSTIKKNTCLKTLKSYYLGLNREKMSSRWDTKTKPPINKYFCFKDFNFPEKTNYQKFIPFLKKIQLDLKFLFTTADKNHRLISVKTLKSQLRPFLLPFKKLNLWKLKVSKQQRIYCGIDRQWKEKKTLF